MNDQSQDLAPVKPDIKPGELVVCDNGEYSMLMDTARFNQAWRVAKMFSESKLVPAHFQGSTASVFVALHMAVRMNLDPMMVMQNTYMVAGRPGMEAKLIIGLVNARGPFKGPIQWEFKGEGKARECTAYAIHRETGEGCEATVDWKMVEAEGWSSKSGSKWLTMPDMMFRYRSAVFLARLYCPEVIMGLSTVDELVDINGEIVEAKTLPPSVEIEKKSQGDKIKEELKTRKKPGSKPKMGEGDSTSKEAIDSGMASQGDPQEPKDPDPGETTQPANKSRPIAPEHLEKINAMLRAKELDPAMICQEFEVESLAAMDYQQGISAMEWVARIK